MTRKLKKFIVSLEIITLILLSQISHAEEHPDWLGFFPRAVESYSQNSVVGVGQIELWLRERKIRHIKFYSTGYDYANVIYYEYDITSLIMINDQAYKFECTLNDPVLGDHQYEGTLAKKENGFLINMWIKKSPSGGVRSITSEGRAFRQKYIPNVKLEYSVDGIGSNE